MKVEHLDRAIVETGRAFHGDHAVVDALRGIRARASRYEAQDPDPDGQIALRALVTEIVKEELGKLLK